MLKLLRRGKLLVFCALLCLLLATAGAVAVAQRPLAADIRTSAPEQPSEEDRTALWNYFSEHYSEGNCSAVYTDLTHDGAEDLVVLEMETGNEPILIHEDRPDMEQVTGGTVTVLHRDGHGTVEPIFSHTLDREAKAGRPGLPALVYSVGDGAVFPFGRWKENDCGRRTARRSDNRRQQAAAGV